MDRTAAFSVRIFLPSGDPEGLRLIEKSNWTGLGLVFPRSVFNEAKQRPELDRTGVYILWGPPESTGLPRVYVGETDALLSRLKQHHTSKDFWTHAVVFVSKDQNLNKAHVQHLESRLVGLAAEAKRATLENGNVPSGASLSEADKADAESFLEDLLLCLPIVGVPFFDKAEADEANEQKLYVKSKGITATGFNRAEGFVIKSGSEAVKSEVPSAPAFIINLRKALVDNGVLVDAGKHYTFTQDYSFGSPSTASSVVIGRNSNGWLSWRDETGRTLSDLAKEEEQ